MKTENKTITSKDKKWMYKYLDTDDEVNEVCNYLDSNNTTIQLRGTFDSQSGWSGFHVILEGRDLSFNGYCFSGKELLNHVRNYKKFELIKKSEEYQKYLELKNKYKEVDQFYN